MGIGDNIFFNTARRKLNDPTVFSPDQISLLQSVIYEIEDAVKALIIEGTNQ